MNFEYLATIKKESSIEIPDIGKFVIDAYNDLGFNYILIVKTTEGMTEVIEYGPILSDIQLLPAKVLYSYERFDFKEGKIINLTNKFLNDGYKQITQAFEISFEEAKDKIRSMVDCICW